MPVRYVYLTIIPYTKYSWPNGYSIRVYIRFYHINLILIPDPEVEVRWTLSDGHRYLTRNLYTKYCCPIACTYIKWEIHMTVKTILFQAVAEQWKWSQGQWTYDRQKFHKIRLQHTRYETSRCSSFF